MTCGKCGSKNGSYHKTFTTWHSDGGNKPISPSTHPPPNPTIQSGTQLECCWILTGTGTWECMALEQFSGYAPSFSLWRFSSRGWIHFHPPGCYSSSLHWAGDWTGWPPKSRPTNILWSYEPLPEDSNWSKGPGGSIKSHALLVFRLCQPQDMTVSDRP